MKTKLIISILILSATFSSAQITNETGYALQFDGYSSYVDCGNDSSLDLPEIITVEAWIKSDGVYPPCGRVLTKGYEPETYNIEVREESFIYFNREEGDGTDHEVCSFITATNDTWIHVASTDDGEEMRLYINGLLEGTINSSGFSGGSCTDPLSIGLSLIYNRGFSGVIDEVRIWNVAHSENEIRTCMFLELSGNEEGLVGYWNMNEGVGDTTFDISGHGNNGIISGALWTEGIELTGIGPPRNLNATREGNTISLKWEPALSVNNFPGYNIYRNGEKINQDPVPDTLFMDEPSRLGEYQYVVKAVDEEGQEGIPSNSVKVLFGETALQFDGDDDYVICGSDSLFNLSNFTVESWFYLEDDIIGTQQRIVSFGESDSKQYSIEIFGEDYSGSTGNQINLTIGNGITWYNILAPVHIMSKRWHHIAATHQDTYSQIYINGELVKDSITVEQIISYTGLLAIGCEFHSNEYPKFYFNGGIDEVRIWNVARTEEEIKENMNMRLNGNEPGLIGYWRMNEGAGNMIHDFSGNGNDGALMGADWIFSGEVYLPEITSVLDSNFSTPVINMDQVNAPGNIALNFSYNPEILAFDSYNLENTQMEGWDVWVQQNEPHKVAINAYSSSSLNMDCDTLIRLNFNIVGHNISDILHFDYAFLGDEFHRTLGSLVNVSNVGIHDLIVPNGEMKLHVYPNPCSSSMNLRYWINDRNNLTLELYSISGKKLKRLLNEEKIAGEHELEIDMSDLPTGIYFCTLQSSYGIKTVKVIKY